MKPQKMTKRERKLYLTARSVSKFLVAQTNADDTYLRDVLYRVVSLLESASSIAAATDREIERDIAKKELVDEVNSDIKSKIFADLPEHYRPLFAVYLTEIQPKLEAIKLATQIIRDDL